MLKRLVHRSVLTYPPPETTAKRYARKGKRKPNLHASLIFAKALSHQELLTTYSRDHTNELTHAVIIIALCAKSLLSKTTRSRKRDHRSTILKTISFSASPLIRGAGHFVYLSSILFLYIIEGTALLTCQEL